MLFNLKGFDMHISIFPNNTILNLDLEDIDILVKFCYYNNYWHDYI